MKKIWIPAIAAVAVSALLAGPLAAKDTLYQQLGGYDGIAVFTDAFLKKLEGDPSLGRFFVGHGEASTKMIRQHIVDFLCEKSGGPCFYTGRPMKEAHTGLKITEKDWDASAKALAAAMNELKVGKPLQDEVIKFVTSLKPDIVGI
jgi:hemoglobin